GFPVERDPGLAAAGDELVVREPVRPRSRVDAHDPEPAERPLPVLPVSIRVDERVLDLLLGVLVGGLLDPPVALRLLENLAPLLACVDRALHSRHGLPPPQELVDDAGVAGSERVVATKQPLTLLALLLPDVA